MKKFFLFAFLTAGVALLSPLVYAADAPAESEAATMESSTDQTDDEAAERQKAREEMRQRRIERRREMQQRFQSGNTDDAADEAETAVDHAQTRTRPFEVNAADGLTTERQARMQQMMERRQKAFEAQALKEDSARSITYTQNGNEVTRFFEVQKESESNYRIVETEAPVKNKPVKEMGKTEDESADKSSEGTEEVAEVPATDVSIEWILSELGYTRVAPVEITEGESSEAETQPVETASSTTITGPDGNQYEVAQFISSNREQQSAETPAIETPEGVQIVSKSNWIKTADGTFSNAGPIRFGSSPMAGQQGRLQNRQAGQGRSQGQNRQQDQVRSQNQRQQNNQGSQRNQNRPRFGQGTPVRPEQDAAKDSDASGEAKTNENQSRRQRRVNQNNKSENDV